MAETGWTFNPLVAIGIGLALMFFGYFFGLFEGRGQGYKKRQQEEADEMRHQPAPPPASPPTPSDETPILNVSVGMDGQPRLKLDGQGVDTSALDAEKRRRLIAILTQMRPWLEPSAPKPAAPQPSASAQPRPASSPKGTPLSERMSQAGMAPSLGTTPPPTPAPAPQPTPVAKAAMPAPDDEAEKPIGPQSIVAQIDSILQTRLTGTPLAGRGIRLQESLQGGVIVIVGINKYESVEDVPDHEIKAAIRAAITEWENKYTPGL